MDRNHVCGLYYLDSQSPTPFGHRRKYLPTVSQSVHTRIVASTSRTTLTQTFVNPLSNEAIPELRYTFPLYDGVSVVAFTCTIDKDRVIKGVVKERNKARKTYDEAVARGETAGLLEQLPDASDVFTTTVGNVPKGAEIKVEITYLGELKHDAEVDGIRFTIPTTIAPRYGNYPGELVQKPTNVSSSDGIQIVVDAEMPTGSVIRSIQSPSHPIAVSVGSTSTTAANETPSLQLASATLSLGTAELEKDFIVQIIATNVSNPVAVLETHPTIPDQQAIMATFVPKFKLPTTKPEVVFVCDRSGSMQDKISDLKNALQIFMKSLPVGCMFNICSFGSRHSFLFEKSKTYDGDTLRTAVEHIETFDSNFGGTEIYGPLEATFKNRHKDLDLEVIVLTDGEVWNQERLFGLVNQHVKESKGAIRLFTLGVGRNVSHALIEGLAGAGKGFTQTVSEREKMSGKVVRMLKGALTPHVKDYTLEVKYADAESETEPEDDFELIETAFASKASARKEFPPQKLKPKDPISLFDPTADDDDVEMKDARLQDDGTGTERFSHVPFLPSPKVLQAPWQIPPLYPYSRTTVYLLLSPDRALRNKTPESVILRGTSSAGPLELQIPVTVLKEKAETVHQLAARKAVKELEEGLGWIFSMKGRDGESLQEKHPGRFSAMVEREAVRLGVQFQVGGKWCSFVAVEKGGDGDHHQPDIPAPVKVAAPQRPVACSPFGASNYVVRAATPLFGRASVSSHMAGSPPPPPSGAAFGSARACSLFPPGGGLFGVSAPMAANSAPGCSTLRSARAKSQLPPSGGLFGAAPARSAARKSADTNVRMKSASFGLARASPRAVARSAQVDEQCLEEYRRDMDEAAAMPCNVLEDEEEEEEEAVAAAAAAPDDKLSALVSMQDFNGFWAWSTKLLGVMRVVEADVDKAFAQAGVPRDVVATAVVVAFLRMKLEAERDCWEMMEEKAVAWLEGQLKGHENARDLLAVAEKVF